MWREALGEPLLTDRCRIKLSDFYLSHVPETKWGVLMWKSFGWCVYLIAPICTIICAGRIAATLPMIDAQINSIGASISNIVGETIPDSLISQCQENCHGFLRVSFGIVYAYFFTWCLLESCFWFYMMHTVNLYESNHFKGVKSHDAGAGKVYTGEEEKYI